MDHDADQALEGEGQGGGTGGTVGNEAATGGALAARERLSDASPTGADPDAWDALPADAEQPPDDDALHARGTTGEDLGETEGARSDVPTEEPIPGMPQPSTADATEGGAGRP